MIHKFRGLVRSMAGVLLAVPAFIIATDTACAEELLDDPIAVVGDRVILRSEWEAQVTLLAMQSRRKVDDPVVRDSLGPAILEQMINDELILIEAEKDTLLKVTADEVDQALAEHIQTLRSQFATDAEFQAELQKENMTERDLRVRYRQEVRDQILKQKLIQRKLSTVAVSNGEVREFYDRYQDSLPIQPEAIKLAHILIPVTTSEATVDSARARLTDILQQITNGLAFEEAARQYSTDLSAEAGGDLGWFGQGDMVPAFETAAMALIPGQISGIVQTRYGLHLIQCVEKARGRVHARHILLSLTPSLTDSARVFALADSLVTAIRGGADFCALAQIYSEDEESRKNCGELGWYPINEMFPEFKAALEGSKAGEIVGPVSTQFGWHILRVLDRRQAKSFDLTNDWDSVREMARRDKTNKVVEDWISGIRAETYVDVRMTASSGPGTP